MTKPITKLRSFSTIKPHSHNSPTTFSGLPASCLPTPNSYSCGLFATTVAEYSQEPKDSL